MLGSCAAHQQMIWLDACHSGSITLKGRNRHLWLRQSLAARPTSQLIECYAPVPQKQRILCLSIVWAAFVGVSWARGMGCLHTIRWGLRGEGSRPARCDWSGWSLQICYYQTLQYIKRRTSNYMNQQKKQSRGKLLSIRNIRYKHRNSCGVGVGSGLKPDLRYFSLSATSGEIRTFTSKTSSVTTEGTTDCAGEYWAKITEDGLRLH